MRDWESALALARTLAQRRLPLSMVRVATPLETATTLALAGEGRVPDDPAAVPRPARRRAGPRTLPRPRRPVGADRHRGCRGGRGGPGRPGAPRRRHARRRPGLAARPLPRAGPARHAVGRRLRGGHAGDRHGLVDPAGSGRGRRPDAAPRARRPRRARPRVQPPVACLSERLEPVHLVRLPPRAPIRTRRWSAGPGSSARRATSSRPTARRSPTSTGSAPTTRPWLAAEKGAARDGRPRVGRRTAWTRAASWRRASCCRTSRS